MAKTQFLINRRQLAALLAASTVVPFTIGGARAQTQVQLDKTIRLAVNDFAANTMDPAMDSRAIVLNQMVQVYDTLLEIGPNSEVAPGVAESWEVDSTGLLWTFKLRKGIQFHDGWGELTSADVAFSLNRFMNEKARSPGGSALRSIIDHVEEVDPYTVKVHAKQVALNFVYLLSPHQQETGIVFCKRYLLEKAGDDFTAQTKLLDQHAIGSGPFKYVSRELGNSYTFEALPQHWRNTPRFKHLEIILVPEMATQMAMLRSGEVDIVNLIGDQVKEVNDAGFKVHSVPGALNIWMNFVGTYRDPAKGKPATNAKLRRALSLAINRKQIIQTVLAGYGNLPLTPLNTTTATADIDKNDYKDWADELARYDPDEARKLLVEAGFASGISEGLQLYTYARPGTPFLPQIAEIIAAQWAEVGVTVPVVPIDFPIWNKHYAKANIEDPMNAGDASTHSSGPRFDALGPLINMWLFKGGVVQLLNDPQLDADIGRAATIIDNDERRKLLRDIENRVNDTWLAPPLFDMDALFGVNPQTITALDGFPGSPYLGRVFERLGVAA